MTSAESTEFLARPIRVEEKIDGANLGISFGPDSKLRFQNRGNWLTGKFDGQWSRLREWGGAHEAVLRKHLPHDHVLFGEWCYANHSIEYSCLPDWFLAFDVYDAGNRRFWSCDRRDILLRQMEIHAVPEIASGHFGIPELTLLLDTPSAYGMSFKEGLYLRRERDGWLISRSKLIRPEFVQHIGDHWSRGPIQPNHLADTSPS